jgi:hypothetical protein
MNTHKLPSRIASEMGDNFDQIDFCFGTGWLKPIAKHFFIRGSAELYYSGLMVPVETHIKTRR